MPSGTSRIRGRLRSHRGAALRTRRDSRASLNSLCCSRPSASPLSNINIISMKKNPHTKRIPLLASLAAVLVITLSSCIIEPDEWWSGPPQAGTRSTTHVSHRTLATRAVQFGTGLYKRCQLPLFQRKRSRPLLLSDQAGTVRVESIRYWSQNSNSGTSYYQINIQYEYDSPVTENYWFTHGGNTLWFQWRTSQGVQTSVYDRIPRAPW